MLYFVLQSLSNLGFVAAFFFKSLSIFCPQYSVVQYVAFVSTYPAFSIDTFKSAVIVSYKITADYIVNSDI